MTNLELFTQSILSRSKENSDAFECLYQKKLYGSCFSILRQEIDSLIRIFYLLSYDNAQDRTPFIDMAICGKKWSVINSKGKKQFITDKDMVELTSRHNLVGWANCVYSFGCSFIHLSRLHNYGIINPFQTLDDIDQELIIYYMNQYHNAGIDKNSSLDDFIPYLPKIFEKISSHVCYYTKEYLLTQSVWDKS